MELPASPVIGDRVRRVLVYAYTLSTDYLPRTVSVRTVIDG